MTIDGGPDDNQRYQNLDAQFLAKNAPVRSSYLRVEGRMASLCFELAGLILPHDHYASHLDERGDKINNIQVGPFSSLQEMCQLKYGVQQKLVAIM